MKAKCKVSKGEAGVNKARGWLRVSCQAGGGRGGQGIPERIFTYR